MTRLASALLGSWGSTTRLLVVIVVLALVVGVSLWLLNATTLDVGPFHM